MWPILSSKSTVVDAITPTHARVGLQARLAWKGYDEERPKRRSTPSSDPNIINTTWVAANVYDINTTTAYCRYKSGYVLKRCKYMPSSVTPCVHTAAQMFICRKCSVITRCKPRLPIDPSKANNKIIKTWITIK